MEEKGEIFDHFILRDEIRCYNLFGVYGEERRNIESLKRKPEGLIVKSAKDWVMTDFTHAPISDVKFLTSAISLIYAEWRRNTGQIIFWSFQGVI